MAAIENSAVGFDSGFDGAKGERLVSRSPGKDQTESQSTDKTHKEGHGDGRARLGLENRKGLSHA